MFIAPISSARIAGLGAIPGIIGPDIPGLGEVRIAGIEELNVVSLPLRACA